VRCIERRGLQKQKIEGGRGVDRKHGGVGCFRKFSPLLFEGKWGGKRDRKGRSFLSLFVGWRKPNKPFPGDGPSATPPNNQNPTMGASSGDNLKKIEGGVPLKLKMYK